jgi:cytochrome c biogenesis protein CcmG, thiol:disulfide interchange protein DsbE
VRHARGLLAGLPVVAVLVTCLMAGLLAACGANPQPAKADRLPDVTLASLTGGQAVDLGTLKGPAVVNLWAQWCGPCKRELPIYQEFFVQHGGQVPVIGVDWQDVLADKARTLARRSGITYPLVVDREPQIRNTSLPKLILLDADGRIAFQEYVEIKSLDQLEQLVVKHLGVTL